MKKSILLVVALFFIVMICTSSLLSKIGQNDFNEIWKQGYINGYCYRVEYCIEPITPVPPIPRIEDTTYNNIYNRGFVAGLKAQPER